MAIVLKHLFNLIYILHSETSTRSISAGFCCGIVLGFSPILSLQAVLVLVVMLVFRVQVGAAMLSAVVFKILGVPLEPLFHFLGNVILSQSMLQPFFTLLYNLPLIPMTRFYNTVVMGAGVLSVFLVGPAYPLFEYLIDNYRHTVVERVKDTKLWSLWKTSKLFKWYQYYRSVYGRFS